MTLVFTICSINYLHQAITLGNSVLKFNPNYKFIIGLVDDIETTNNMVKLPDLDILPINRIIDNDILCSLKRRYNIIELNTSVKPYYFEYFFKICNYANIIYLDPDIEVFNSLDLIDNLLNENYSCIVTPHCVTPKEHGSMTESLFLKVGIFNLGFIAIKNNIESIKCIEWWKGRLYESCYMNTIQGQFVDQLWANLFVCYFDNIFVLRDVGYNMAPWNLHERTLSLKNEKFYVNDIFVLVFFHFSSISDNNKFISSHDPDLNFNNRPDLKLFIIDYKNKLILNNKDYYKKIKCAYLKKNNYKFYINTLFDKTIFIFIKFKNKFNNN